MADWKPEFETGRLGLERYEDFIATRTLQCLVVAAEPARGALWTSAAHDAGWKTMVSHDAVTARRHAERTLFRLAIVDLQGAELDGQTNGDAFRPLVERLAASSDLLLAVCGREGDADLEIWARQLGAWLFLPGLPDVTNLVEICAEALQLARRISGVPSRPDVSRTQPFRAGTERSESAAHHQAARRAARRLKRVPARRRNKPFRRRKH